MSDTLEPKDKAIGILLAESHRMIRQGLHALFERRAGITLLAEAEDGRKAVDLAVQLKPDIVILNVIMPELNGIDTTRNIVARLPRTRVIALSGNFSYRCAKEVFSAGASALVLLNHDFADLVNAVEMVARGDTYVSSDIGGFIIREWLGASCPDREKTQVLTPREREVLQLLAEGKASKEIADIHHVSIKTIEFYRTQIGRKLNIRSIAGLTKFAIREGLTTIE